MDGFVSLTCHMNCDMMDTTSVGGVKDEESRFSICTVPLLTKCYNVVYSRVTTKLFFVIKKKDPHCSES